MLEWVRLENRRRIEWGDRSMLTSAIPRDGTTLCLYASGQQTGRRSPTGHLPPHPLSNVCHPHDNLQCLDSQHQLQTQMLRGRVRACMSKVPALRCSVLNNPSLPGVRSAVNAKSPATAVVLAAGFARSIISNANMPRLTGSQVYVPDLSLS